MNIPKTLIRQGMKYIMGGGIAAVVDLISLYVFTDILGIYYIRSSVYAFIISFIVGFFFQKYITFNDRSMNHMKQWGQFLFYQLIGQSINMILLWLLVSKLGVYYMFAAVFNKGVVFFWNFIMNYLFNFKERWN